VAPDEVTVIYRKYDGTLHWDCVLRRLGEDEHGVWLGAPAGAVARRGRQTGQVVSHAHVVLLPRSAWWTATFNAAPKPTEIYCDVSTPPVWSSETEVSVVDLDLDVRRRRSGEVDILDEDEFVEHQARYRYPGDVVTAARSAAQYLSDAVRNAAEPFGSVYRDWLARVRDDGDHAPARE
jgi:protein associated with RNAse G/E